MCAIFLRSVPLRCTWRPRFATRNAPRARRLGAPFATVVASHHLRLEKGHVCDLRTDVTDLRTDVTDLRIVCVPVSDWTVRYREYRPISYGTYARRPRVPSGARRTRPLCSTPGRRDPL